VYGKPFREGIHSYLHQSSKPYFPFLSALLCLPLCFLPVPPVKIAGAFIVMILCPALLLLIARRVFGGVNGDVSGASNEICRACVVLAFVVV
jgi:adenosylcobinamide-GDP ribazoletransferase